MEDRIIGRGLTFDDVLLSPAYSEVMPSEVKITKSPEASCTWRLS